MAHLQLLCVLVAVVVQKARAAAAMDGDEAQEEEDYITYESAGLTPVGAEDTASILSAFKSGRFVPHTPAQEAVPGRYLARLSGGCQGPVAAANKERVRRRFPNLGLMEMTLTTTAEAIEVLEDGCIESVEQDVWEHSSAQHEQQSLRQLRSQTEPLKEPPYGIDLIDDRWFDWRYSARLTGDGVDVMVLDTGIDAKHEQISGSYEDGWCYLNGIKEPARSDPLNGHGTHVAGTIVGNFVGVAPGVRLFSFEVCKRRGGCRVAVILAALNDILDIKQSRGRPMVISASFAGSQVLVLNEAFDKAAVNHNITVVVGAGNRNKDARWTSPCSAEQVICVGAIDSRQKPWSDSNWGPPVDIWAPGVEVQSAKAGSGSGLTKKTGTSFAVPHVTGAVALILEARPLWTPEQVKEHLISNCQKGKNGEIKNSTGAILRTFGARNGTSASKCAASGWLGRTPWFRPDSLGPDPFDH